jgi:hypothetical protein
MLQTISQISANDRVHKAGMKAVAITSNHTGNQRRQLKISRFSLADVGMNWTPDG